MTDEPDADIRFATADVGELTLHYAHTGNRDELVVLLHGFPEFWYSWRHQLTALSDTYTVVAPDLRGYNLSDRPKGSEAYKIERLSADIAGLIRGLGRKRAHVVGHDWGAAVAWDLAIRHPGIAASVTAMQVPPPGIMKRNILLRQLMASWYMFFFQIPVLPEWLLSRSDFALLANSLKNSTARQDVITDEDIAHYRKAWSSPGSVTAMLNYYRANVFSRLMSKAANNERVTVPTMFIFAEKDLAILPQTVAGVGEMIDAYYEEHRIPDSGHWVQQEAADEVTQLLRNFLGRSEVKAAA